MGLFSRNKNKTPKINVSICNSCSRKYADSCPYDPKLYKYRKSCDLWVMNLRGITQDMFRTGEKPEVVCPKCSSTNITHAPYANRYECKSCGRIFS